MTATRFGLFGFCVMAACLLAAPAKAAIIVYDLGLDFSNTLNPSGV